jgi:hypothetical protein
VFVVLYFVPVPGERFELPTNGLQNRCSTTELTRHYGVSKRIRSKLPPDCHRQTATIEFQKVSIEYGGRR